MADFPNGVDARRRLASARMARWRPLADSDAERGRQIAVLCPEIMDMTVARSVANLLWKRGITPASLNAEEYAEAVTAIRTS